MKTELPTKHVANFIWHFIKEQRFYFIIIQILAFAWAADNTVWPYILKTLIDKITTFSREDISVWLPEALV